MGLALRRFKVLNQEKKPTPHLRYPRNSKRILECISKSNISSKRHQSLSDTPEYKLSLIVPAYNEEKRLKNMLDDVLAVLKSKTSSDQEYNCEVILVDDGSKDKTVEEYKKIVLSFDRIQRIDFKLMRIDNNSGKGRAVSEVKYRLHALMR